MKWINTFVVGARKCELSYSKESGMNTEWSPDVPKRGLSDQELAQYRSGRDNLLAEVGKHLGCDVMVVET